VKKRISADRRRLVALFLLAAAPLAAQPAGLAPVRHPDLAPLEKAVAEQIAAQRELLDALLADPAAKPAELADAFGDLGRVYHVYGLAAPAEDCYRNAARLAPDAAAWPHLLGMLLQGEGRLDEAAEAYARALALRPDDVPALVYRGEILLAQGKLDAAADALQQALALEPAATAARALLGQVALARRDFPEAVKLLTAALAEKPEANRLHYSLGLAYRGLGDRPKAEEHLAKAGAVGVVPADPLLDALAGLRAGERVHIARGRVAFRAGRWADAAEEFRKALAARPESVEARVNLGSALVQTGDLDSATLQFREALRLDPNNATAHFNLGLLLSGKGPTPEALEHLRAAVDRWPRDAEARRTLARLLRDAGRLEEALAEYGKAVELDPAEETARLGEADTLARLGRYGQARQRLEEALRSLPGSGRLSHGLARLLAASPDPSVRDGARALELGLAVWKALPLAAHAETVALAQAELGRCAEAAEWQRRAIDAGRKEGFPANRLEALSRALVAYERGAPCRPPGVSSN
jgi:tetratricopeptide (TPR) repeat protein